jgi:glycosyltransferase involved in cell wall biosynthesis
MTLGKVSDNQKKKLSISNFFPVYNDWGTIGSMVALAISTLEEITDDYEIILVDDGSNQATLDVLSFIEKSFPHKVRVVHHDRNRGYGGALKTGIKESRKEFIFYTDSDAQYDVRELRKLVEGLEDGIDVVNGYKVKRNDPWYRVVIGKLYHAITKFSFGFTIRDVDCDFRLMRRSLFDRIELESDSGTICVEMIKKLHNIGAVFGEVPVHHFFRASGKSEFFNFRRVFRVGIDLTKLWWKLVFLKKVRGGRTDGLIQG